MTIWARQSNTQRPDVSENASVDPSTQPKSMEVAPTLEMVDRPAAILRSRRKQKRPLLTVHPWLQRASQSRRRSLHHMTTRASRSIVAIRRRRWPSLLPRSNRRRKRPGPTKNRQVSLHRPWSEIPAPRRTKQVRPAGPRTDRPMQSKTTKPPFPGFRFPSRANARRASLSRTGNGAPLPARAPHTPGASGQDGDQRSRHLQFFRCPASHARRKCAAIELSTVRVHDPAA